MKYYKVVRGGTVIDVLTGFEFVKYDARHDDTYFCDRDHAEGFLSSDRSRVYRIKSMPVGAKQYDTVLIYEIDKYEYEQLVALTLKTPQEIIDAYTLTLLNGGILI